MNKQELIEKINGLKSNAFKRAMTSSHPLYAEGVRDALGDILDLINKLDEPQKVKVPKFVVPFIEKLKNSNRRYGVELEAAYNSGEDEDLVDWLWFNLNVLTLFRALENGYEVEEEPKWIVRVGEKLLFKEFNDNEFPVFIIDDQPGSIQLAENFELEKKAKNVQKEVGGTVEKVVAE